MFDLIRKEIQDFIIANTDVDLTKLALQKNPFPEVELHMILNQIAARKKAKTKLPSWFSQKNILYPSKISVEQTSSEHTAQYKASLVEGKTLIDLTGGFGVDIFYFSKTIKHVSHCEISSELSAIVSHNAHLLGLANCTFLIGDSTEKVKKSTEKWDWIYVDPSRRNNEKGKVFMLCDCSPNVPELLDLYFAHSQNIMIKTAPLLDISAGILELKNVKCIHIVAVENEVKELVWILEKDFNAPIEIFSLNMHKGIFRSFKSVYRKAVEVTFSLPLKYLYEPNAAIMKSGAFDEVSHTLKIAKLHTHSHLYTSDIQIADFPGRTFVILHNLQYNKANMKSFFEGTKTNVATRNFPEKVAEIRKKWKIAEGGNTYSFFTTDLNENKLALLCKKLP